MTKTCHSELEAGIVRKILTVLTGRGVILKVHGGRYQASGFPDILFWRNGVCYAFEVKRPGEKYGVTPLQEVTLNALSKEGVVVAVVHSPKEVIQVITERELGVSLHFSEADMKILNEDLGVITGQNRGGST